jgi:hypothetical protein
MLKTIKDNNYKFIFFNDLKSINDPNLKIVLLRHDIDFDPFKAQKMCNLETKYNVFSTYFFLLNSDFYNIHNIRVYQLIKYILKNGNDLGVHFNESNYRYNHNKELSNFINKEIKFFEELFEKKIKIISFHRPTNNVLLNKIDIPIEHTYNKLYAKNIKYLSDSKKNMREGDFIDIINSNKYKKIQLLIHPFWWGLENNDPLSDYKNFIDKKIYELKKEISNNSLIYNFEEVQNNEGKKDCLLRVQKYY